jgi:oligopeptide/dipeptide ABC transporter ATP-binding protein
MTKVSKKPKTPILRVNDLVKHFPLGGGFLRQHQGIVRAVDGVSFDLYRGETLGIVGESGCGKSTVARTLLQLEAPNSGSAEFDGNDLFRTNGHRLKVLKRRIQVVFQDPYAALNPRMTINDILTEPFRVHTDILPKEARPQRVRDLLEQVGLRPEYAARYPHEFSGGQLQRIGIARALALQPDLLILDEPVSALDVSVQAQVVNLLEELQQKLEVAYIFIAHDLSIVRHISDRVAVMYLGRIVEIGDTDDIYGRPAHPYTRALLSAEPKITLDKSKRRRILLKGEVPSPVNPPSGCRFRNRCWKAETVCKQTPPTRSPFDNDHKVSCHFPITEKFPE